MTTVSDFRMNLKKVDVKALTDVIIKEQQNKIIDLNREDQVFRDGIDSKGMPLGLYSSATQRLYNADVKKGLINDTRGSRKSGGYNLFWTGKTYKSYVALRNGFKLIITSTSPESLKLMDLFSPYVFGLTEENKQKLNWEIIAPELNEKIRKVLL